MNLTAAIPVYNAAATLPRVIAALRKQIADSDGDLLVVDNGSTDSSATVAAEAGARVVRLEKNLGRGAARARILAETNAGCVLMCDATIEIAPGFVAQALARFSDVRVAAVFGRITQLPPRDVANRWRGRHLFKEGQPAGESRKALLATGACMLRAEAVRDVGGFDPAFWAHEDADLGRRLLAADFDVVLDPQLWATVLTTDSVFRVLERYARWNTTCRMTPRNYLRQIAYSVKVMARADLQAGDPLAAVLSLLTPHYQFWGSHKRPRDSKDSRPESPPSNPPRN